MKQHIQIGSLSIGIILLSVSILLSSSILGQNIGINSTGGSPDASAMLDISDTTRGLLVPRMTQSQRNNISSPAVGLLIFQTDVNPGFRWYNGSSWTNPGAGTNWSLDGNTGLTTPANFLGSTDSNDVLFKSNNTERMIIAANGNVGLGQPAPKTALHLGDGLQLTGTPGIANIDAWMVSNFHTDGTKVYYTNDGAAGGIIFFGGNTGLYHWTNGTAGDSLPDDPTTFAILNDNGFCINCDNPDSTFQVEGSIQSEFIQLSAGAFAGHTLVSDAVGHATWEAPAWTINGNDIYRSNAIGAIGIGTTVPRNQYQLDLVVASSLSRSKGLLIDNNYNGSLAKVGIELQVGTAGTGDQFGIQSFIEGTSGSSGSLFGYYTKLEPALGTNYMYYGTDNGSGSGTTFGLYLENEDRNYLSSSLSIGTTDQVNELNVNGFATFLSHGSISHPSSAHLAIGNFSGTSILQASSGSLIPGSFEIQASTIAFATSSSILSSAVDRVTILNSGNVGIGDSSPLATLTVGNGDKFQVNGTSGDVTFTDDEATITFPATTGANSPMVSMFASGTANADRMVISHSPGFSSFGLRYDDVSDKFHFTNSTSEVMTIDLALSRVGILSDSPAFTFEVNGTAAKPGGGSWSSTSDARLKDIAGKYEHGLAEVLALNPIRYRYKVGNARNHPSDTMHVGLVAQEVQLVFPEAVSQAEDGYLSLNNDPIIIAYINAIKELNSKNEALDTENEKLSAEVARLRQEVALIRELMDQYLQHLDQAPKAQK